MINNFGLFPTTASTVSGSTGIILSPHSILVLKKADSPTSGERLANFEKYCCLISNQITDWIL